MHFAVRVIAVVIVGFLAGCSSTSAEFSATNQMLLTQQNLSVAATPAMASTPAPLPALAPLPAAPPAAAEAQAFALAAQPNDLKIMSFNLRVPFVLDGWNYWTFRRDFIVSTVENFQPDILGTQECPRSSADYLREKLTAYDFVGVGRNDGKLRGEMCGMFFRRDRFTKMNEGHFWLSDTPSKAGSKSFGNGVPRMVSWVTLQPKDGSAAFCWFNTHFDNASARSRMESAKLLRAEVKQISGAMPAVVTGDFNADQHTEPYELLVGGRPGIDTDLFDAFRLANPIVQDNEGTMHNFHGGKNGPRIDWILTNAGFQPLDVVIDHTQRGPLFPSDHFPVRAIMRFNAPAVAMPNLAKAE